MAKKSTVETTDGSTKDSGIIEAAKKCLEKFQERESDNIRRAEEAIRFRAGEQWPDPIKRERENPSQDGGPRPCPVLDKTNQYVRQVINEERQNRAAIRVRPVDDGSDKEIAEVLTGIIRHIEDASNALDAYTTAGEHAIDGGWGFFRILTEYTDDMSFDQDIRIKRIPNRFSVALGPHIEPDGSDAKEALIWEDIPLEDFKAKYPKAKTDGFDDGESWADKETIRVAEYMCIKPEAITIHQLQDGSVVTDGELKQLVEQFGDIVKPLQSRTTSVNRVHWYKITAQEILDDKPMIGRWIPVVKVIGNELVMPDGKTRLSGMIETMMDPQRLHNYAHAGFIENVALAPRAPWVAPKQGIAGYEDDYADANRRNITVLTFNHIDDSGNPIPMPQRTPPAGISSGWQQMLANTEHGIEGAAGMYGPSVGATSQEKSGIALREQKSQGMVGNFHFPDNLARSIQHGGRILVEWIPKVYDTERVARILGEDGKTEPVYLNPEQEQAVMPKMDQIGRKIGMIYNLNIGKYDVVVSTGPSYSAKRQEAFDIQTQIIQARPDLMNIIGDLVFSNMDAPGADKISERLKKLLPPQLQESENGDPQPDPRMQAMMQQIEQAAQEIAQRGQMLAQAQQEIEAKAQEVGANEVEVKAAADKLTAERKVFMAEANAKMLQIENAGLKMMQQVEGEAENNAVTTIAERLNNVESVLTQALNSNNEGEAEESKAISENIAMSMQAIAQALQGLSAPKRVVFDNSGNPVGIEPMIQEVSNG